MKQFKFIDLFSGIGGFHQAMTQLGGKCILASEIDANCNKLYEKNYGVKSNVNVREVDESKIEDHTVLCAGFPCQAFSKAGKQAGLADKIRGTLFFEIARILKEKKPRYIILENVRNIISQRVKKDKEFSNFNEQGKNKIEATSRSTFALNKDSSSSKRKCHC